MRWLLWRRVAVGQSRSEPASLLDSEAGERYTVKGDEREWCCINALSLSHTALNDATCSANSMKHTRTNLHVRGLPDNIHLDGLLISKTTLAEKNADISCIFATAFTFQKSPKEARQRFQVFCRRNDRSDDHQTPRGLSFRGESENVDGVPCDYKISLFELILNFWWKSRFSWS